MGVESRMKQILLDNAYEAWRNAIYYHDAIEVGISSFGNQKGLVSSLHNAVELFMKQIMLDNNDHRVAWIREPKKEQCVQIMKDYLNSDNLNEYFSYANTAAFYSMEFSQLSDNKYTILDNVPEECKGTFSNAIKLLKDLRNNETHFYINPHSYLSESDFCLLHNFMVCFYEAILDKNLFKRQIFRFHNEPKKALHDFQRELAFTRENWKTFSYKKALKNNSKAIALSGFLNDPVNNDAANWAYNMRESLYELAWHIKWQSGLKELDNAEDNYKILLLLDFYDIIEKEETTIIEKYECGDGESVSFVKLRINM